MSDVDEGTQTGGEATPTVEKPQTVSMSDHIGVKEMLRKREAELSALQGKLGEALATSENSTAQVKELEERVRSLDEQVVSSKATAVDPAELEKVTKELTELKGANLQKNKDALVAFYSVDAELLKDMTLEELTVFEKGLRAAPKGQEEKVERPGPDLGGGSAARPTTGGELISAGIGELFKK